jgi:hypothetical protein
MHDSGMEHDTLVIGRDLHLDLHEAALGKRTVGAEEHASKAHVLGKKLDALLAPHEIDGQAHFAPLLASALGFEVNHDPLESTIARAAHFGAARARALSCPRDVGWRRCDVAGSTVHRTARSSVSLWAQLFDTPCR